MALCFAALVALGNWQVQRLHWKEALIARVQERLSNPPVSFQEVINGSEEIAQEYTPVEVSGYVKNTNAAYEFTTFNGRSGWNVFLPFRLEENLAGTENSFIMVNWGFVPYESKDHERPLNELAGRAFDGGVFNEISTDLQKLSGLLRLPLEEKPGYFVNDNILHKRTFFWRDLNKMQQSADVNGATFKNWYLDRGLPGQIDPSAGFPIAGTTLVTFSNNHLQYVITWYGLALALLGVGSYFLYQRRKQLSEKE